MADPQMPVPPAPAAEGINAENNINMGDPLINNRPRNINNNNNNNNNGNQQQPVSFQPE